MGEAPLRNILPLILALTFATGCSRSEAVQQQPKPALELTGNVMDAANLLPVAVEKRLADKLAAAELAFGPQMVVVTTPSLGGRDIAAYTIDLARGWGVGDKKRNDGLVLLVAPNERKVRIEVGYGLEGSFSDAVTAQILQDTILPSFKDGDLESGIEAGVDQMIAKMKAAPSLPTNDNTVAIPKDKAA